MQDPQEKEMEKRLLLAMLLSMAVLFLIPALLRPAEPTPGEPASRSRPAEAAPQRPAEPAREEPPAAAEEPGTETPQPATRAPRRQVEIRNQDLILEWDSLGASLSSIRLRHYRIAARNEQGEEEGTGALEVLPPELGEERRILGVRTGDVEVDRRLAAATFEIEGAAADRLQAPARLTLLYRDELLEARREVSIPASGYVIQVATRVRSAGRELPVWLALGPGIGPLQKMADATSDFTTPQAVFLGAEGVVRRGEGDLEEPLAIPPGASWAGIDSKYFAYVILNPAGGELRRVERGWNPPGGEPETYALVAADVGVQAGADHTLFMGPKDIEILDRANSELRSLIDFGYFGFLVKPLLFALKFIYGYAGNYGWGIIILTFLINLALFPVRFKQMASMKKMSVLQPQMKAIQDKYKKMKKDDPRRQKMNEEVMALYREHGVNPLSGCLPLLIQMPFLFAFYSMLYSAIELRGAEGPFFLWWIHDLSQPDPIWVTPILMGATMIAQQAMTPAAGDPAQRKMMMFLPVIFTFLFLGFSSGLVLYFLFSNVFGMMLQFLTEKWKPELARGAPSKQSGKKKSGNRQKGKAAKG